MEMAARERHSGAELGNGTPGDLVPRRTMKCDLVLQWSPGPGNSPAKEFIAALASFLFQGDYEAAATLPSGEEIDGLDLDELAGLLRDNNSLVLRTQPASFADEAEWVLEVTQPKDDKAQPRCALSLPCVEERSISTELVWLQADLDHAPPFPTIAVPTQQGLPTPDFFHGLVVLASRLGRLESAELIRQENKTGSRLARWQFDTADKAAVPVFSHEADALFLPSTEAPVAAAKPQCWVLQEELPQQKHIPTTPTDEWRKAFRKLLNAPDPDGKALSSHLHALSGSPVPIDIVPLSDAPRISAMAPRQDGVLLVVAPTDGRVCIGIEIQDNPEDNERLLLHAYGHVLLGHVRPDDDLGHWDTRETALSSEPDRRWDREVHDRFADLFKAKGARKVESLDDCTTREKAQLGLWRMMGEVLGESRRLHKKAANYQRAAYQRQAAQRMVAMLEEFGGSMLCDGVGLGKTYVATTLIVHYANTWRDQHKDKPDAARTDPFRVTVLSPNSVVTTWRREAIAPLAAHGVPLSTIRVISHTKLSRITRASDILQWRSRDTISDLEHLLLSDLVIVDEAHNFRSISASRTKVLRDLLRLQPRRELQRRVALLTATPINNSLEDLRQQASLLFSKPLWLSDARSDEGYRRQALKEIADRAKKARSKKGPRGDVAALVVHGRSDSRFSDAIEFRDDLDFGPNVQRIGDYLKEQDKKLKTLQSDIRAAAQNDVPDPEKRESVRIAEELLDRIVVQRSRGLCKQIEQQQDSDVELLFRPDQGVPEKLYYSDEYDGIQDVLARFLPLFDTPRSQNHEKTDDDVKPLTLKVYMWYDVREGIKGPDESSPVVGLQRILVLKRLESSPVSFLITLLRLAVLHAHRLQQLQEMSQDVGDRAKTKGIKAALKGLLDAQSDEDLDKIRTLTVGDGGQNTRAGFMRALSKSYVSSRPAADTDDPPPQLALFTDEQEGGAKKEQLHRLWGLRDVLLRDFKTLLKVTPRLADIIFGRFSREEWPHGFITDGVEDSDWPTSPGWGLRIVKDAKLRSLVRRLLVARRAGQKAIVFTQFSDTIAYIESVLRACRQFTRDEWQLVANGLGLEHLKKDELTSLLDETDTVTGATEDRDHAVNAFAPFYRIGPHRPVTDNVDEAEQKRLLDEWELSWSAAIARPRHVLISTDVLAEGVNLQDVSLLVNFDVHWNPVRMIQRAGRIDRRLNPAIEKATAFPELAALAEAAGKSPPTYYFHEHPGEAPATVNLILPDELEAELQLRERIATKTLAIDFTLGLEQGTGAEAAWMEDYKYQGISSLNSFQKDRAIEQVAGHHERLTRAFGSLGARPDWAENLNGWFRSQQADESAPLIARAKLGLRVEDLEIFSRYLEPAIIDGDPHWYWAEKKPGESMFDGWLILDGKAENFPPRPRRDVGCGETVAGPVKAAHLLVAAEALADEPLIELLANKDVGRPLLQGASAIAAPKLGSDDDRRRLILRDFFLLQLSDFAAKKTKDGRKTRGAKRTPRRGTARTCKTCGHEPGMHKCCPRCGLSSDDEHTLEKLFGFRAMSDSNGSLYEVPQPWCRECRSQALDTSEDRERQEDGARDA